MHRSGTGRLRRAAALAVLTPLVFGLLAIPASAHYWYGQKPGDVHCDAFSMKDYTKDVVVENPTIKMYDDYGNLLAVKVGVAVVVDATVVVCVEVDAEADVDIFLGGILDDNKDGKYDTIDVIVNVLAKADVHAKVVVKVRGRIGLFVAVAVQADVDLFLKGGEKKGTHCYTKDGVDSY